MDFEAREQFNEAMAARRQGDVSQLDGNAEFTRVKPDFYVDSKLYADDVTTRFLELTETHPPYGLVDIKGDVIEDLTMASHRDEWIALERALSSTAAWIVSETIPPVEACPYHEVIGSKLGGRALEHTIDNDVRGLDTFRRVFQPGATFAPATVVPLIRAIPRMNRIHGSKLTDSELASNSRFLLRDPLAHPQQWAKAFPFCLAGSGTRSDFSFDRTTFLPDQLIRLYTQLSTDPSGKQAIEWRVPTRRFFLQVAVSVPSRVLGSEMELTGDHVTKYPAGTRMGDITVDEPTLGCPGKQLAYAMWDRAVAIADSQNLWTVP